jgi:hypothetical protein
MKQFLAGVAVAALLGAVPALAQTTTSPAPGTGATATQGTGKSGTSAHQATRKQTPAHRMSSRAKNHQNDDAMTEQLNRQELDRLQRAGG